MIPAHTPRARALEILADLRKETERRKRWYKLAFRIMMCNIPVIGMLTFALLYLLPPLHWSINLMHVLQVANGFAMCGISIRLLRPSAKQKALLRELSGCDDPRAVGPLLEFVACEDKRTRLAVQSALVRALPQFGQEEAARLEKDELAYLNRALMAVYHPVAHSLYKASVPPAVTVALIETLGRVGDERALADLERIAQIKCSDAMDEQIRSAAATNLPALRQRVLAQQQQGSLLSPADAPHDPLLRPAHTQPGAKTEQLLRSVGADSAEEPVRPTYRTGESESEVVLLRDEVRPGVSGAGD